MRAKARPTTEPIPTWLRYAAAVALGVALTIGALLVGGHSDLVPRGQYEVPPFAIDVP